MMRERKQIHLHKEWSSDRSEVRLDDHLLGHVSLEQSVGTELRIQLRVVNLLRLNFKHLAADN